MDKIQIPEDIKASVKNRVGYIEAENKNSFITGSEVSFSIAEEYFAEQILSLKREIMVQDNELRKVNEDISTIVRIFHRYDTEE